MKNSPEGDPNNKEIVSESSGEFSELSKLASDALNKIVGQEASAVKAEQETTVKEEKEQQAAIEQESRKLRESQEALLNELIQKDQERLVSQGEEQYYFLSENSQGLKKIKRHEQDAQRYKRVGYAMIDHTTYQPEGGLRNPQDFFTAYDQSVNYHNEGIQEQIDTYGDIDGEAMDERINQRHQTMIEKDEPGYLIGNDKSGDEWEYYKGKDLPPDLFARYVKELDPSYGGLLFQHRKGLERDKVVLRSFTKTALDSGDVESALEGHFRLEYLDNPEFVKAVKKTIQDLQKSEDPTDKLRLKNLAQRIQEIKG